MMDFILNNTGWGLAALALAAAIIVLKLFGLRAALGVLALALPFIAYRTGRDSRRKEDVAAQQRAREMVEDAEADAIAARDRAAERVRNETGRHYNNAPR